LSPDEHSQASKALFRWASIVGGATAVIASVMIAAFPARAGQLAPGLRTPIIAFEFALTRSEVEALFGPAGSELRSTLVQRIDLGNQIDFAFMALYGAFLALAGFALSSSRGRFVVPGIALLAAVCDALENLQLFTITGKLGGDYDDALSRLFVFTWLKWGALALALTWLAPALGGTSRTGRVVAVIATLAGTLAVGASFDRAHFAEPFAFSVTAAFLGLFVVSIQRARG
jgi:hypothetical protein